MSKEYIDKILLDPKRHNPYAQMKPAVKDRNFYFTNCISYNLIENLTQFKNMEIDSPNLNLHLLSNLSFLFANKKIITKKKKEEKKLIKSNKNNSKLIKNKSKFKKKEELNDFKILDIYECYIPIKRIPVFNKKHFNEKSLLKKDKENNKLAKKNIKELKFPQNLKTINFFRPTGRIFTKNIAKNKRKTSLMSSSTSDVYSDVLNSSNSNTNNNYDDGNDSSGDYSLICGEESNDNIFQKQSFIDLLRTSTTFPKYNELTDLIECPMDDPYPPDIKCKKFINILDKFINDENYSNNSNINNNNNNNIVNSISSNSQSENTIINLDDEKNNISQKTFIINPANLKPYINELDNNKIPRKSSKSGKIKQFNIFENYNSSIITSASDDKNDESYKKEESLFAFFESDDDNKKKKQSRIDIKIKRILPKSALKYINKMNNQYIFLMYERFKIISKKWDEAKSFLNDEIMLKKLFIQLLKRFLLDIGISSKKFYDKIIKYEIHSKEAFNFEHFMNVFELMLIDNNKENLRYKFLLLLKILSQNNDSNQILIDKQMNMFFDMIECENIYIPKFCEILGEKVILRYKAIYFKEKDINEGKFLYKKIRIILESFLDRLEL